MKKARNKYEAGWEKSLPKIIECMRDRFLPALHMHADCPEPVVCGPCDRLSCKEELHQHRQALKKLIMGQQAVTVSEGTDSVTYANSSHHLDCLKEEIKKLEFRCGDSDQVTIHGPCGQEESFIRSRPMPMSFNTSEYDY